MIRWLRILFLVVLAVVLLTVALAHRDPVAVKLMPENLSTFVGTDWAAWSMELPLYAVIFGGIVAGLLIGFFWEWMREHKHRAEARRKAKEVKTLQREVSTLKSKVETANAAGAPKNDVLTALSKSA
ncbi:LapA family protein [Rhodobacter sp. NSM]|uniref:LapA family protein n=1 Tax=Rhodobacter sp. NSM TaxID=3457501 RepID=UPI003FD0883E